MDDRESISYLVPDGQPDPLTLMTADALWKELDLIYGSRHVETALYRSMATGIINELQRRGEIE